MTVKHMSTEAFDRIFDEGEKDIIDYLDLEKAVVTSPNRGIRKVNVDMPDWMVDALDDAAGHLAINRQALIKIWLADRIKKETPQLTA
ncbi:MAG: CopG family transcriptional regulator [Raoultibacter sp.]